MIRKIVHIDEEKCNGCGACAEACHEGAIAMINGKARLIRDDYCDGMGDCLPECPAGAIEIKEREADAYDEEAVKANMSQKAAVKNAAFENAAAEKTPTAKVQLGNAVLKTAQMQNAAIVNAPMQNAATSNGPMQNAATGNAPAAHAGSGCPGTRMRQMNRAAENAQAEKAQAEAFAGGNILNAGFMFKQTSQLQNWPVQIKLAPTKAPYFKDAKLLIAADCTAYAYASFHQDFIKGKVTLIGCPKLDAIDYSEKLTEIIKNNDIKSVTIVRMEVPCCGGLEFAAKKALQNSGKFLPWQVVTISIDGKILD